MELKLNAEKRINTGKKAKKILSQDYIPSAIYGYKGNFNIQVKVKDFRKIFELGGYTSIIDLVLENEDHSTYIQEIQIDPVSRNPIHISFREVDVTKEVSQYIPFVLTNEEKSPAVREQSGLVLLSLQEIELYGLPKNLPKELVIDASSMNLGDVITVSDIKLPEGVELVRSEESSMPVVTTASSVIEDISTESDETKEDIQEGAGVQATNDELKNDNK